ASSWTLKKLCLSLVVLEYLLKLGSLKLVLEWDKKVENVDINLEIEL
ncbi:20637_t:CDS:1, partial [Gigaspora margarita]